MHPDHAALEAIGAGLDQLLDRIDDIAERHRRAPEDPWAAGLDDLERALRTARRRLDHVLRG